MSQTNTNTNNSQNWNQISGRGRQGQGPLSRGGRDCRKYQGNISIANKYSFEGKMKEGLIFKLIIT